MMFSLKFYFPTKLEFLVLLYISICNATDAELTKDLLQIRNPPIVRTAKGLLQGSTVVTNRGNVGYAFQGTPFVESPIGRLRFLPPVRKSTWNGTYPATKYSPACPQNPLFSNLSIDIQSEDCVYLMIYTPTANFSAITNASSPKYPVIYYIHGGGFGYDSPVMFPPEKLIDHFTSDGVIFIMVSYRLGPFGFWTMGTKENQGNMGVKDIIMGLEWVQDEIAAFGGDPNKVTLMGHSSGGGAASMLSMIPATEGLVHQLISMSGASMLQETSAVKSYGTLPNALGCPTHVSGAPVSYYAILNCMQSIDTRTILDTYQNLSLSMGPRIDGSLIPANISTMQQSRRALPGLFGTTSNEFAFAAMLLGNVTPEMVRLTCNLIAPTAAPNASQLATQVCNDFYVDRYTKTVQINDSVFWSLQLNKLSSISLFIGSRQDALSLAKAGQKVGLYEFSYVKKGFEGFAPYHSMDLTFMMGLHSLPTNTPEDERIGDIQSALFANFVKTSNPTPETNSTFPRWWKLGLPEGYNYYDINLNLTMSDYYHFEEIQLWSVVIPLLQKFAISTSTKSKVPINVTNFLEISVTDVHKVLADMRLLSQNFDLTILEELQLDGVSLVIPGLTQSLLEPEVYSEGASAQSGTKNHAGASTAILLIAGLVSSVLLIAGFMVIKSPKRNLYKTLI